MQKNEDKDIAVREKEKAVNHAEDIAHKAAAQYFGKEIMAWLEIPGAVRATAPTEHVNLGIRHLYEDFNFIMESGEWYHFEFESDKVTRADLKRFREYEATTSKVHDVDVVTYIICSDAGQRLLEELKTGINTYRVKVIRLKEHSADEIFKLLQEKKTESVDSGDLIPVAMCPLLGGQLPMKERVVKGIGLLKNSYPAVQQEKQQCLQAILYVLASKFLDKTDMEEVKEELGMSYLGELIYDNGYEAGKGHGMEVGKELGKEEGREWCIVALIRSDLQEGATKETIFEKLKKIFNLDDEKMENYWRKSIA